MPAKAKYIWMHGKIVPWDEALIHVCTHTLHYASGVFEGARCYKTPKGPAVFRLDDHTRRFFASAHINLMDLPFTQKQISDAIVELIRKNELDECYIRPIAYRAYTDKGEGMWGEFGLNPLKCRVEVDIIVFPWGTYLGERVLKEGARCMTSSWRRPHTTMLPIKAKSCANYLNSALAKVEALQRGYDEAIMLDHRGLVSEGSAQNLFVVKDGVIYTPPLHASILAGITRDSIIQIARELGHEVSEVDLSREDVYTADEVFLTGTASEVAPVRELDGRVIGEGKPGPITQRLQKAYFSLVRGKATDADTRQINKKFSHWLTYV
jgi:branched-chain amino acid aminotransferase